jgi:hypothetical protein
MSQSRRFITESELYESCSSLQKEEGIRGNQPDKEWKSICISTEKHACARTYEQSVSFVLNRGSTYLLKL